MTTLTDIYGSSESKYIKAADLQKKAVKLKIANNWTIVEFDEKSQAGEEYKAKKLVLHFEGREKGWVVNKTNAAAMEYAFGPDVEDWVGREIELYPTIVDFQGQQVEAIRVRATIDTALDDEVPF